MKSSYALKLNHYDLSNILLKTNKYNLDSAFSLVGIKYLNNVKYYMVAPVLHIFEKGIEQIYDGPNINEILIQKIAIDITEDEYKDLQYKNYIVNGNNLKESDYPVCIDGEYNENKLVILGRFKYSFGTIIYFATGDGILCSSLESDLINSSFKYNFELLNASITQSMSSYLRANASVFKYNIGVSYHTINSAYLSYIWMNGCRKLNIIRYNDLDKVDSLFNILFNYYPSELANEILGEIKNKIYVPDYRDESVTVYGDRFEKLMDSVMTSDIVKSFIFEYSKRKISFLYMFNNEPVKMEGVGFRIKGKKFVNGSPLIKVIDERYLILECSLPGIYMSETVYFTLNIDFKTKETKIEDIEVYTVDSEYAVLNDDISISDYGKYYYILTGDSKYLNNVDIDLSLKSCINNTNTQEKELSIETLCKELESLGYRKKVRQSLPDYVYMDIYKSAWLNENEFVTLREYKSGSKSVYQLDLYQDGSYHSSLSGDFKPDAISRLIQSKSTKTNTYTYLNVPSILSDMYEKDRNLIAYDYELFFTDYSAVYSTLRGDMSPSYGKFWFSVARFNPTGEYCICYFTKSYMLADDMILQKKDSGIKGVILARFKNEKDMFNVYTSLFRKKDCVYTINESEIILTFLRMSDCINNSIIYYLNNRYSFSEAFLVTNCVAKRLGFLNIDWKEIFSELSDEEIATMIFE